jgi:hypothetical protein
VVVLEPRRVVVLGPGRGVVVLGAGRVVVLGAGRGGWGSRDGGAAVVGRPGCGRGGSGGGVVAGRRGPKVAVAEGVVAGVPPGCGDSLGGDMTGLESGVGVGLDDAFGLLVTSSPQGALVVFFLAELADGDDDGDEAGLEVAGADAVALTGADAVAVAVAEPLGVGDGELAGEVDGEPDVEGDGDEAGVQEGTGATAGAWDGLWLVSVVPVTPLPLSGLWLTGLGTGWPDAVAPVMALADPLFALPPPVLELCPDSTEELSWTMAWRSGGTARATPAANSAQANASAGRSIMSRRSQRVRRRRVRVRVPGRSSREAVSLPVSDAARAGPERIFSRMRSRPSGRGSTCSAAACNAERTSSAKSWGGRDGGPDLTFTPAPARL